MPDTADHRAEMHQLATERRAAGLPMWDRKINVADVFHNEAMTFEERRDAIVARLQESGWLRERDEFDDLGELVCDLAESTTVAEFDSVWDQIYDEADSDRVWIGTF